MKRDSEVILNATVRASEILEKFKDLSNSQPIHKKMELVDPPPYWMRPWT